MYYVQMFVDTTRHWRWRLRSAENGEILASSEAYSDRSGCYHTAVRVAMQSGTNLLDDKGDCIPIRPCQVGF